MGHIVKSITDDPLDTWIIQTAPVDPSQMAPSHLDDGAIELARQDPFDTWVHQQLTNRAAITTADDQGRTRGWVSHRRQLVEILVIEPLIPFGAHQAPIQ